MQESQVRPSSPVTEPLLLPAMDERHHETKISISEQIESAQSHEHYFYGRDEEKRQLVELYQQLKTKERSPKYVTLISGSAGCGKTTLARSSLQDLVESDGGYFISGKFEQFESPMPLTAFTSALQQLCDCLNKLDLDRLNVLRVEIRDAVGSELDLLISLVPGLRTIMYNGDECNDAENDEIKRRNEVIPLSSIESVKQGLAAKRVEFACRKFLRIVASPRTPVVWLLDDLQWADPVSLDFFYSLVSDRESTGILFLAAFRNEPPSTGMLKYFELLETTSVHLHRIELSGLNFQAVSQMVNDVLQLLSQDYTESLSKALHSIGQGNPLFMLELLRATQEDGLIRFDEKTQRWQIDLHLVQVTLQQNSSVIDLLQSRLQSLPTNVLELLKTASYLGSRLDDYILSLLLPDVSVEDAVSVGISNYVLKREADRCVFSHDHVQKAAYNLIPEQDRPAFHFKLGRRLLRKLEAMNRLDDFIFMVVDQLISGASCLSDKERSTAASLCLRAGTKAVQSKGFSAASVYLQHGIDILGRHCWTENYNLCLQLHNLNAEACYCTANYARVNSLVASTLENARCFEDTIPIRSTQIYALSSMGCLTDAIESGLSILEGLGEGMESEPSKLRVLVSYWKTKRVLSKKSDSALLRLPFMTDPTNLAAMHVLNLMIVSAIYARPTLFAQIIFKMIRMTVKHGVCAASCVGFAYFGMILSG
jgi:predicted ATPase